MLKLAVESLTMTFTDSVERDAYGEMLCVICIGQSRLASMAMTTGAKSYDCASRDPR